MQQHGSKYFACILPPKTPSSRPWWWGQKVKIQLFQNMVTLHIKFKWNHKCSSMVANILPTDPSPRPWGSIGQNYFFQNLVMLHIKLNAKAMQQHAST